MNEFFYSVDFEKFLGLSIIVLIIHFIIQKKFIKWKIEAKENFENIKNNSPRSNHEYNYKKYLVSEYKTGYTTLIFIKCIFIFAALIELYKIITNI